MAPKTKGPDLTDQENPEWTAEDFARARPASELPADVLAAFPKTKAKGGRPKIENPKQQVTLRLAPDVLEHFKRTGPGWQSRMEAVLRNSMGAGAAEASPSPRLAAIRRKLKTSAPGRQVEKAERKPRGYTASGEPIY